MGNLYSVAEAGIDYVLRGIFYLFSPVLSRRHIDLTRENFLTEDDGGNSQTIDESHIDLTRENFLTQADGGNSQTIDESHIDLTRENFLIQADAGNAQTVYESSPTDENSGCKSYSIQILNCEESSNNGSRYGSCFIDLLKNFFRNYNFQTNVLSGNARDHKRIKTKRQADRTFRYNKKNPDKWNVEETSDVGRFGQQRNVGMENQTTSWQINEANKKKSRSKRERSEERLNRAVKGNVSSSSTIGVQNADENFEKSFQSNIEKPFHNSRERKHGFVPTDEVSNQLRRLREEFSGDFDRSTNRNVSENDCKPREISRSPELRLKKLSLPSMHSGCHLDEGGVNIPVSDFGLDSTTFVSPGESYRRISHPNLYSGGLVAFEELSKHLSIPDYYAEDSVFYDKLPDDSEVPLSSPINLTHSERSLLRRSCSGGGVVVDNSRRVSLPDIFPQKNLLLTEIAASNSNENSATFGRLATPKEDGGMICSDLLSKSRRFPAPRSADKNVNNSTGREPSKSVSF